MGENQEKIDWQSFLPKAMPALRESAALALGDEYEEQAEDIVMDTVFSFLSYKSKKYLPDFRDEKSALAFLKRMIRNAAIEYLSNLKKRAETLDTLEEILEDKQATKSLEDEVYDSELEETLRTKLGPLTPRERLLLRLHLSGYTSVEIANMLQEDTRFTRYNLNAIRAKLRYRLAKQSGDAK